MRRGISLIISILLLTCILSGCEDTSIAINADAPEESIRLVVYTSHKREVYEPVIREFEDRTGIWVSVETGGTNELLERVAQEAEAPVCDIMFGGGVENLEARSEYFTPYRSPESKSISPVYASKDNIWTPFSSLPIVLIYNTKLISPEALKGWNGLLSEEWKGKIAFADPAVSGSSYTALCTLCQIAGGSPKDTIRRFAQQIGGRALGDSGQVTVSVADGSFLVGITLEETALKRMAAGDDIGMIYPSEGTSAVPDGSALVKGAPHEANAKLFLDFVLGRDVQNRVVREFSRRSVRADIPASETLVSNTELRIIDYDIPWASGAHAEILNEWSRAVGGEEGR